MIFILGGCGVQPRYMYHVVHGTCCFFFLLSSLLHMFKLVSCKAMLSSTPISVISLLISISLTYKTNKERKKKINMST